MTKFFTNFKEHRNFAFTMAEILLSLTIIGVVAAITLPSLTGNINERTWNTQRKALYARMSQAMALMPALNGFGSTEYNSSGSITNDTAGQAFVTELGNVLKINNVCDNAHLEDCGITKSYNTLTGSTASMPIDMLTLNPAIISVSYSDANGTGSYSTLNTNAVAFETQNGESILAFYNPHCTSDMHQTSSYFVQPYICANLIYDLNGKKGPNTVGKDLGFITILYAIDGAVVAPMPFNKLVGPITSANASSICTSEVGDEYRLPSKDELASLFVNRYFMGYANAGTYHWYSNSKSSATTNWVIVVPFGQFRKPSSTGEWNSLCIKR